MLVFAPFLEEHAMDLTVAIAVTSPHQVTSGQVLQQLPMMPRGEPCNQETMEYIAQTMTKMMVIVADVLRTKIEQRKSHEHNKCVKNMAGSSVN